MAAEPMAQGVFLDEYIRAATNGSGLMAKKEEQPNTKISREMHFKI